MYNNASELYNEYLGIYYDQYMALPDTEKRKLGKKYHSKKLFLEGMIIVCGQKKRLIKKECLIKKN